MLTTEKSCFENYAAGRVIGIAFASFSGGQNLNFAIPSSYLQKLLQTKEPLKLLGAAKPARPARSILAEIGETAVEGAELDSFLWSDSSVPDGKFTVSIRNKLRQAIRDVRALVVFSDSDGKALDNVEIRFEGVIGAGLTKRALGSTDPSVHRITDKDKPQGALGKLNSDLAHARESMQADADAARADIERRDAQIAKLTTETNAMTRKLDDLNASIDKLGNLISDTERKLAASEGDREFLLKELKRMQVEKADLERQFNELSVLRTQVAKLKEELTIARRLQWIRQGTYGASAKKGAEKLIGDSTSPTTLTNLIQFRVLSFELAD